MLQIRVNRFGGPEVLEPESVPDLSPGPGQVLVRTLAAGVTFVDTQLRAGRPPWPGPPPTLPFVPGNGVAGVVSGVGEEGSARELIGRTVVCSTGGSGGYAEQVVVPAAAPIVLPDSISPAAGVSLLADGRTAFGLVRAADVQPGDRVLVLAAGGAVGSLLVQLARTRGANVIVAAAGSRKKLDVAVELGADETVNYTHSGWSADLRRRIGSVTVVFDGVGGPIAAEAMSLLSPFGRFAGYGGASGRVIASQAVEESGKRLIRATDIVNSPADNRLLVESALAAATGHLRVVIGQQFHLTEAADAHAAIGARTTIGKTVLFC